jgi:uncharacterized membrane protein
MYKYGLIILMIILTGCTTIKYENSIKINASEDIVFKILEDYENYPNIIPDFHTTVKIISENRTGKGVQFDNFSSWKSYKYNSLYEVIEYKINEYIKLENKTQYGITELIIKKINKNETEYTLINYNKVPFFMKKEIHKSFDNELEIIKRICEE